MTPIRDIIPAIMRVLRRRYLEYAIDGPYDDAVSRELDRMIVEDEIEREPGSAAYAAGRGEMAAWDYRHCDMCGGKAFYDADLNYMYGPDIPQEDKIRGGEYQLDDLGDWGVLCRTCAKTHRVVIVEKKEGERDENRDGVRGGVR